MKCLHTVLDADSNKKINNRGMFINASMIKKVFSRQTLSMKINYPNLTAIIKGIKPAIKKMTIIIAP